MGEAVHIGGQRENGKSLYLPLNFAVNLKLLLKSVYLCFQKGKNEFKKKNLISTHSKDLVV